MKKTFTIKLPAWTTKGQTLSNQLPAESKYLIGYTEKEHIQWRGGSITSQFASGYHFHMELKEWFLQRTLRFEVELHTPVLILYFGFKGHLHGRHQESRTQLTLPDGQYGIINVPPGTYKVTINKGYTLTFLYYIDPKFLDWLNVYEQGFSFLSDYGQENQTYFKFPFCNISYPIGRMIRQLKILGNDRPASSALSDKLVSLLMQYQRQLKWQKEIRDETPLEKIERMKVFINEEIDINPLPTIPQIARMFAIGHRTLRRLFKNRSGISLSDFIHQAKMSEGLKRLKNKETVTDISIHLGYASLAAFSKSFTKFHGFSPESVRKN